MKNPLCNVRRGLSLGVMSLLLIASAVRADIIYIYDDLGRLKAVVDPTTDAGVYTYDAVGNLLGIERRSAALLSLIEFNPKCGATDTTEVVIYGTGFSVTSQVTFNGIIAPVFSATATQIVTSIPAGATNGPITVITPTGSVTSAQSFIVGACST